MPGIIKSDGDTEGSLGRQAVAFNFEDMSERAERYLQTVKEQADSILREAKTQAEQLRARAENEGRENAIRQARQESQQQVEQKMKSVLPAIESAAGQLQQERDSWVSHWEHQAVALAIKIAEKIIRQNLEREPDVGKTWLKQSLELISRQERVTIELSPDAVQSLGPEVESLAGALGRVAETTVVSNSELQQGECRVLTQYGEIDQRLKTQLDRIESELT